MPPWTRFRLAGVKGKELSREGRFSLSASSFSAALAAPPGPAPPPPWTPGASGAGSAAAGGATEAPLGPNKEAKHSIWWSRGTRRKTSIPQKGSKGQKGAKIQTFEFVDFRQPQS